MKVYFSPLACSMATRISLYEAAVEAEFIEVDTANRRLADGSDYLRINPLAQVPVLQTDQGALLSENVVVLSFLADTVPALAPADEHARRATVTWLSFIATELHKLVFTPLLDRSSNEGAREFARAKVDFRFGHLDRHLNGRHALQDRFGVADAYLTTVLNWTRFVGLELERWPAVRAYLDRSLERPAVSRALAEEMSLYQRAQARRQARGGHAV